jgi:hypothetical protein
VPIKAYCRVSAVSSRSNYFRCTTPTRSASQPYGTFAAVRFVRREYSSAQSGESTWRN